MKVLVCNGVNRLLLLMLFVLAFACRKPKPLFSALSPGRTKVSFKNTLPVADSSFNILDYIYYFNGGGVATGDINNDGLVDIYFSANMGSNKLYLNKGDFVFEDVTEKAGVGGLTGWNSGVTMADINGDGLLDIYVCVVGNYKQLHGRNRLYINNGNLTFTESAEAYGLDISAFSTQATFLDYDKDGDLDMFLTCHSIHSVASFKTAAERSDTSWLSGDKLFRNNGPNNEKIFTEVTRQSGIYNSAIGYGLNVIAGDFNNDNWDDLYVSNDFHENDYYYLNNRDGTFSEVNKQAFGHESRFSMGSDAADINNDGWLDVITLDMLAEDEKVLKSSAGDDPLGVYNYKLTNGFHYQYSRNCLQLNVGGGHFFSDIGLYAGIAATDWSWCPLAADFDNDGIKDLFITNGIAKRPNDLDYVKYTYDPAVRSLLQEGKTADVKAIDKMPSGEVPNYIFQGQPDMRFVTRNDWGFNEPSLSNGAAYADLDNDGDLDIVINNLNSPAGIYKNNSRELSKNNYIDIELFGKGPNKLAYGAKILAKSRNGIQVNYVTGSRGFLSASTTIIHFGIGQAEKVDTLEIHWPSGSIQQLYNLTPNRKLIVNEGYGKIGKQILSSDSDNAKKALFEDVTDKYDFKWKHQENNFNDYDAQALIPHKVSTQGPKVAVSDVNGDGLDDFFVCGARGQASALYIQDIKGGFHSSQQALFKLDSIAEDVNALFFDANGDNYPDLYVVTGGNDFPDNDRVMQDRLYINDGAGMFAKSAGIPLFTGNKSVAVANDFDKDGDADLFIGGRVITGSYGVVPGSYLLINNGKGKFSLASDETAPGLNRVSMVTDAVWTDMNKDGWFDLIVVGEWMPITVFMNNKGKLENQTKGAGLSNTTGLWQSIISRDIDNNGYPDLLVGNWGENSKLKANERYPLILNVGDPDQNGLTDQVMEIWKNGKYFPFNNKEDLERQFPFIRKKFEGYFQMAGLTAAEIFGKRLDQMKKLTANTLSTSVVWNREGKFTVKRLPDAVQMFPVFAWNVDDYNGDGVNDILAGGNFYGVTPYEGRYDGGYAQVLLNKNNGVFETVSPLQSGVTVCGEIRSIQALRHGQQSKRYLVARNNDSIALLRNQKTGN